MDLFQTTSNQLRGRVTLCNDTEWDCLCHSLSLSLSHTHTYTDRASAVPGCADLSLSTSVCHTHMHRETHNNRTVPVSHSGNNKKAFYARRSCIIMMHIHTLTHTHSLNSWPTSKWAERLHTSKHLITADMVIRPNTRMQTHIHMQTHTSGGAGWRGTRVERQQHRSMTASLTGAQVHMCSHHELTCQVNKGWWWLSHTLSSARGLSRWRLELFMHILSISPHSCRFDLRESPGVHGVVMLHVGSPGEAQSYTKNVNKEARHLVFQQKTLPKRI